MAPSDEPSSSQPKNDVGFRRTWDREEYAARADKREREEEEEFSNSRRRGIQRDKLIIGNESRDIESRVGETFLVTKDTHSSQAGGFYCKICQCQLRDSISYLDHINGRRHQKMQGMSMQVEKSTVAQVRARLADMVRRKEQKQKEYDFEEQVAAKQSAEEKLKAERRARKKEYKRQKLLAEQEAAAGKGGGGGGKADDDDTEHVGLDTDQAALLGFSGFGGSKKID